MVTGEERKRERETYSLMTLCGPLFPSTYLKSEYKAVSRQSNFCVHFYNCSSNDNKSAANSTDSVTNCNTLFFELLQFEALSPNLKTMNSRQRLDTLMPLSQQRQLGPCFTLF